MNRGEIWWADLPQPEGSEPGFRRPVVIIQSEPFNRSRIRTVVVAVITSNVELGRAPGNVSLARRTGGLTRASVVNVSQLLTLDKRFLGVRVGTLPPKRLEEVDGGLRLVLAL